MVGNSGSACERREVVTATGRSLPDFTCGIAAGNVANMSCTWPDNSATSAGPPPLYGTWTMSIPAIDLSISPARCDELPTPAEGKLSAPGFDFASAIRSFTVFTGDDGCTTRMLGVTATRLTGAKSFTGSNGSFLNRLTLMALGATLPISSV